MTSTHTVSRALPSDTYARRTVCSPSFLSTFALCLSRHNSPYEFCPCHSSPGIHSVRVSSDECCASRNGWHATRSQLDSSATYRGSWRPPLDVAGNLGPAYSHNLARQPAREPQGPSAHTRHPKRQSNEPMSSAFTICFNASAQTGTHIESSRFPVQVVQCLWNHPRALQPFKQPTLSCRFRKLTRQ